MVIANVSRRTEEEKSLWFTEEPAYSLKLKLRPDGSVVGEEGPALDTALEGMLPSIKNRFVKKELIPHGSIIISFQP